MFAWLLELLIITIVGCGFLSQVILPIYKGTKMFPLFRREQKLRGELAEAKQEQQEKEIEKKIEQVKKETR